MKKYRIEIVAALAVVMAACSSFSSDPVPSDAGSVPDATAPSDAGVTDAVAETDASDVPTLGPQDIGLDTFEASTDVCNLYVPSKASAVVVQPGYTGSRACRLCFQANHDNGGVVTRIFDFPPDPTSKRFQVVYRARAVSKPLTDASAGQSFISFMLQDAMGTVTGNGNSAGSVPDGTWRLFQTNGGGSAETVKISLYFFTDVAETCVDIDDVRVTRPSQ